MKLRAEIATYVFSALVFVRRFETIQDENKMENRSH